MKKFVFTMAMFVGFVLMLGAAGNADLGMEYGRNLLAGFCLFLIGSFGRRVVANR